MIAGGIITYLSGLQMQRLSIYWPVWEKLFLLGSGTKLTHPSCTANEALINELNINKISVDLTVSSNASLSLGEQR